MFVRQAAELRECRDAVAEGKPLPPLAGISSRTCDQQFFRGLPKAIRVLTATQHLAHRDTPSTPKSVHLQHLKFDRDITESQARLLGLSSNAKQVFARGSYIQLDQPDIVTDAIREVYEQSKSPALSGRP